MAIPVGEVLSVPAQVVVTSQSPPLVLRGVLRRFDGAVYEVQLDGIPMGLRVGALAVLDLDRLDAPLIHGRITSSEGDVLQLEEMHVRAREPREFPRVVGDLTVRYRVASAGTGDEVLTRWQEGGREPPGEPGWHRPARLLDWSAAGLGFEDARTCAEGDWLLMEIAAGEQGPRHRAVGRVIRVLPLPTAGAQATHRYAVNLEQLSAEAREHLLEQTIARQRFPGEPD